MVERWSRPPFNCATPLTCSGGSWKLKPKKLKKPLVENSICASCAANIDGGANLPCRPGYGVYRLAVRLRWKVEGNCITEGGWQPSELERAMGNTPRPKRPAPDPPQDGTAHALSTLSPALSQANTSSRAATHHVSCRHVAPPCQSIPTPQGLFHPQSPGLISVTANMGWTSRPQRFVTAQSFRSSRAS